MENMLVAAVELSDLLFWLLLEIGVTNCAGGFVTILSLIVLSRLGVNKCVCQISDYWDVAHSL